jgi:hypothetical protein
MIGAIEVIQHNTPTNTTTPTPIEKDLRQTTAKTEKDPGERARETGKGLIEKFRAAFDVVRTPGRWNKQKVAGGPFPVMKFSLSDQVLMDHLSGACWLACHVGEFDGIPSTCWLFIDLDDHGSNNGESMSIDERLERVIEALAPATPLVCSSPRGDGRHVGYRLEGRVALDLLHDGTGRSGPVVWALEHAGLTVEDGSIEIYPRTNRAFRLPFGRNQRVVSVGRAPVQIAEEVAAQLDYVNNVFLPTATPISTDWLAQISEPPKAPAKAPEPHTASTGTRFAQPGTVLQDASDLWQHGLRAPRTQDEKRLFLLGEIIKGPVQFGLPADATDLAIAEAVADWILTKHNGLSQTVRDYPERSWWIEDNLSKLAYIRGKRQKYGPYEVMRPYIDVLTNGCRDRRKRYSAEVWATGFISLVWWIESTSPTVRDGDTVEVVLASKALRKLPGGGRHTGQYLTKLQDACLIRITARHSTDERRCRKYAVQLPPEQTNWGIINARTAIMTVAKKRKVHHARVMHASIVTKAFDEGELHRPFGPQTVKNILSYASAVEQELEVEQLHPRRSAVKGKE